MMSGKVGDIPPPKPIERGLRCASYLCLGFMGFLLLLIPPTNLGDDLGRTLTPIWCAFILTSVPAAVGALTGRYRVEYAALPWFTGALILAVIHTWLKVPAGDERPAVALYDTVTVLLLVVRFATLHQLVKVRVEGAWTQRPSKP